MRKLGFRSWLAVVAAALLISPVRADAEAPWEGEAFAADPAAIVAALSHAQKPSDAQSELLFEECVCVFDAKGRQTLTCHNVYRRLAPVRGQGTPLVAVTWSPWYQKKPRIRVRVITPDGGAHQLDPKTLVESPLVPPGGPVFSDRRVLQAPLPAVEEGAVIEEEYVIEDMEPFFEHGCVEHFDLAGFTPIRKSRLTIDAPSNLPLRYEVRGENLKPKVIEHAGRKTLSFERGPVDAVKELEAFVPSDAVQIPHVIFSTGNSWGEIAAAYGKIVDERCQPERLRALVQRLCGEETSHERIAAKLMAHAQSVVRFTAVSLGESSILPEPAETTLRRQYGDCKDQSTLLAGMLRAAGIPAQVALLRADSEQDVAAGLPGLNAFDHAIVHIPGNPPLWIDPTGRHVRIGQLPLGDEGRLALIAGPNATGLVRTPASQAADNRRKDTYEVHLVELKGAQFVRTTEVSGVPEREYRSYHASAESDPERLRKNCAQAVKEDYQAELKKLDYGDPQDLSKPFRMRVEADQAWGLGSANAVAASVRLSPEDVFGRLPYLLSSPPSAGEEPARASRRMPLVLPEPHVVEVHYRILPPPGFALKPLPESKAFQVGPARYSQQFQADENNVVTGTFRFDTGSGEFSAEETKVFRSELAKLQKGGAGQSSKLLIEFLHVGARHLQAGRTREGIAEYRRLLDGHPGRAFYWSQYANALLVAGFGDAARKHARKAVEMEPKSANAQSVLAFVLTHDALGRQFRDGFDWQGAHDAYRRCLELDPNDFECRLEAADLLVYDKHGIAYCPEAQLKEAIAAYEKILQDFGADPTTQDSLATALLYAERFEDLARLLDQVQPTLDLHAIRLAGVAAADGKTAALDRARTLGVAAQERRTALGVASDHLSAMRRYPLALALLEAALEGQPKGLNPLQESSRDVLAKMRRYESVLKPPGSPEHAVQRLLGALLVRGVECEEIDSFVAKNRVNEPTSYVMVQRFGRGVRRGLGIAREWLPDSRAWLIDTVSLYDLEAVGDDACGYRVAARGPGQAAMAWYVVRDQDKYLVRDPGEHHEEIGAEAIHHLAKGDPASARRWLEWAWEVQGKELPWFDSFSGSPFARLWRSQRLEKDPTTEALRTAAAMLVARGKNPQSAIPVLVAACDKAEGDRKLQIERALASAYLRTDPAKCVAITESMLQKWPNTFEPCVVQAQALWQLGKLDDILKLAERRLKLVPKDPWARRVVGLVAHEKGDFEAAERDWRVLLRDQPDNAHLLNLLARNALWCQPIPERALEDATHAAKQTSHFDPDCLLTLAAVQAELGNASEAREALLRSIDLRGAREPGRDDWYVVGRIAESYGLNDVAIEAYGKMEPDNTFLAVSLRSLAQERLTALKKPLDGNSQLPAKRRTP